MSEYVYQTTTNTKPDSRFDVLGHLMPARVFFFVTVDEVGPEGFLVRKTYTTINNPYLGGLELSELQKIREVYPELTGLWARNPDSLASIAEHVLGRDKVTSFSSASGSFPEGSPRFDGKTIYVDIAKAKRYGAKLVTPDEIGEAVDGYLKDLPSRERREGLNTLKKSLGVDNEYLVKPAPVVPADGIFSRSGLAITFGFEKWARVVQVFGIFLTGYDLAMSAERSIRIKSIRPIEKSTLRQMAGWEGSIAGRWASAAIAARIGAAEGTLCGIELGPGAFITGLVGGIIGSAIGYFGENYILDKAGVN
ncbi:glycine zipper family protein [Paraburkholderia sp. DHOC27]|uniref:glycine zipper family protein n=1 Tax=Paraburkholderia sp. DHOC27 TaxID=2303330 RepID=UPI000E3E59F7|nr:glycine zipper family protein [Paraburkholderia sp. DHOC27]RFU45342.1 glycine zipper family protein [Paraburkholderia sp. DHOC27]